MQKMGTEAKRMNPKPNESYPSVFSTVTFQLNSYLWIIDGSRCSDLQFHSDETMHTEVIMQGVTHTNNPEKRKDSIDSERILQGVAGAETPGGKCCT